MRTDDPSDAEIDRLRAWTFGDRLSDYDACAKFIADIWSDMGTARYYRRRLRLTTGGWSANEEIVGAIPLAFRAVCWQKSERGGWHVYKIPRLK